MILTKDEYLTIAQKLKDGRETGEYQFVMSTTRFTFSILDDGRVVIEARRQREPYENLQEFFDTYNRDFQMSDPLTPPKRKFTELLDAYLSAQEMLRSPDARYGPQYFTLQGSYIRAKNDLDEAFESLSMKGA